MGSVTGPASYDENAELETIRPVQGGTAGCHARVQRPASIEVVGWKQKIVVKFSDGQAAITGFSNVWEVKEHLKIDGGVSTYNERYSLAVSVAL